MKSKVKSKKPYPDFPLFLHQTGQWAKKVRGKLFYFGKDPDAALKKWLDEKDDLKAKRTPRARGDGLTVRVLANAFLNAKTSLLNSDELSPRTWRDYYATCETLVEVFGKEQPVSMLNGADFERLRTKLATTRGAVALGNEIQRVRSIFGYAWDETLIDKPVRFGASFKKPSRKAIRKARNERGSRMVEAEDLRKLIDTADGSMKAMILLAINCGFGQSDISELPKSAIDLKSGWCNFPRPKTEIVRRCPLWPETVDALKVAIAARPKAKSPVDDRLAFLTRFGVAWVRMNAHENKPSVPIDSVGLEFGKLVKATGIPRCTFYDLRHVHRTKADGAKDQPAADFIMGHVPAGMASNYRHEIADERLQAVVKVVREWLWPIG
ncbi:MAG TPA: tyrosine-type recombinase/integrase [Gemmata sp.]|nr:tyrosine-type recombinase/integrase [Gemmata sp.]